MYILFVTAVADDNSAKVLVDEQGNPQIMLTGSANIWDFIHPLLNERLNCFTERFLISATNTYDNLSDKRPDIVFNEISEPDSHINALRLSDKLFKQFQCPVINPPSAIVNTRRERLAEQLSSLNSIRVPSTIRCAPESPEQVYHFWQQHFPGKSVLIRGVGDHGGQSTLRLGSELDLHLLYRLPLDGRHYLLSEYIDYISEDGLYRKFRVVLIDGQVYLRHLIISDQWMIHSNSRDFMRKDRGLVQEEERYLTSFKACISDSILADLQKINRLIGAEYLGLDCTIKDNQLMVFELNANMNILINNQADGQLWQAPINQIKEALLKLITAKIRSSKPLTLGWQQHGLQRYF